MAATSKVNTEWAVRLLIIAVAAIAFGCGFLYDGYVAWPEANRIGELTHEQNIDGQWVLRADWDERMQAEGLAVNPSKPPDPPRPQQDITMQFVWAGVCFPVGLLLLINLQLHASRKLYTDDNALHYGRKTIRFDDVQSIDYGRWDTKGIAVVRGSNTSIKLDDWKYKGAAAVLADVEAHAPHAARKQEPAAEPPSEPGEDAEAQDADEAGEGDEPQRSQTSSGA